MEDAGRHCGRRGHLSSVSLEDANPLIKLYICLFIIMNLRLPSENAKGTHIFLSVFQRLPSKHEGFNGCEKNYTTLALSTFVCKEWSYNIKGTPRWQGISKGLYTNDALCLPTTSHRRTQRKKVHHKLPCFHIGNNALLRLACEGRLSMMCSASSQRHTTASSMCQPPINYVAASITRCCAALSV